MEPVTPSPRGSGGAGAGRWPALLAFLLVPVSGCSPGEGAQESRAADGSRAAEGSRATEFRGVDAASGGTSSRAQELPEGVTSRMVAEGEAIFHGVGFCYACHGEGGTGMAQLGADLTDGEWTHTDGSYQGLVERIGRGVRAEESASGVPMPPRGGGRLTDDQLRAVAAYVWALSRGRR